jgi:hypothetical protein
MSYCSGYAVGYDAEQATPLDGISQPRDTPKDQGSLSQETILKIQELK